nr:hypothetical transcript [Hymenolepis microstoma]
MEMNRIGPMKPICSPFRSVSVGYNTIHLQQNFSSNSMPCGKTEGSRLAMTPSSPLTMVSGSLLLFILPICLLELLS